MADLTYRVSTGERESRYGHFSDWQQTTQELASMLAKETRQIRPDITGPLAIHVWPTRNSEHYRQPIPDNADRFDYPAT